MSHFTYRTTMIWIAAAVLLLAPANTRAGRFAATRFATGSFFQDPQETREKEQERRERRVPARVLRDALCAPLEAEHAAATERLLDVARVPAAKIEAVIVETIRQHLGPDAPIDDAALITTTVRQIEV